MFPFCGQLPASEKLGRASELHDYRKNAYGCFGSIVLKKSFWGDERKVSEPLMRLTRVDVRDHIVSP